MARFGATWTDTEHDDARAGQVPTVEFWKLYGENIEGLGQLHNHGGDTPDGTDPGASAQGGPLYLTRPLNILFLIGSTH